jgi:CheY-like chemotaxis protein
MNSVDEASNIRVLILEDDPVWQTIHSNTLASGKCETMVIDTIDEALRLLKENYFQLAIIDLDLSRSKNAVHTTSDNYDEGWQLVNAIMQNGWLDKMVVCVVSHWSEIRRMAAFANHTIFGFDQLRPDLALGVVVNNVIYFSKNEYQPAAFWQRIEKELQQKELISHLCIRDGRIVNLLSIRMTRNLIDHIESESEHSRLDAQDLWLQELYERHGVDRLNERLDNEIENLLLLSVRQHSEDIDLRRIGSGFSKASVVRVSSLLKKRWTNEVIIKMGYHREIQSEWQAYDHYVAPHITRCPPAQLGPKTPILSSIIYDYVGDAQSFETVYKTYKQQDIENILEDLFKVACDPWYSERVEQQRLDARQYIEYLHCHPGRFIKPLQELEKAPEAQGGNLQGTRIQFPTIAEDFPNPVDLVRDYHLFETYPALFGITHGDFNANNILLIEEHGKYKTIMIDFARTGEAHILRDFVQLEAVVKFVLLENATLSERYELESALLKQANFADIDVIRKTYCATGEHAQDLQRAFDVVCKIRELAWEVGLNHRVGRPVYHFEQYQMGLFFLSVNSVRFLKTRLLSAERQRISVNDGITAIQALHALLAAAMLVEKLVAYTVN